VNAACRVEATCLVKVKRRRDGNELLEDSKNIERKLIQVDIQDTFHKARGGLVFSYSMAMNPNRLISALTKNVVFIRRVSEATYELSTVSITRDDELIHFTFQMTENRSPTLDNS
jgi:hypothetical protein